MRELEFRAWDNESKSFFPPSYIATTGDGHTKLFNENTCKWKYKNLCIEQYTGLKDKNEKKIFEGDIVEYKETIPSLNHKQYIIQNADFVQLDFIGVVVWDDEGCSFDIEGLHEYRGFGARGDYTIKILGNIHQNPELLGVQHDNEKYS